LFKTFGIAALAAVVALVVGFGARGSTAPTAHADTTDVVVIGCEFIAGAVDGDTTNAITSADVQAACGGVDAFGVRTALPPTGTRSIASLAKAIGNEDGILTASDFRGEFDENWDSNQLSTDCHFGGGTGLLDFAVGMACTLDVFVFTNHEGPVTLDLPAGLASIESPTTEDFTCSTDGTQAAVTVTGVSATGVFTTSAPHGLAVGDSITVTTPFGGIAAGTYIVQTVPTTTTFTVEGITVLTAPYTNAAISVTSVDAAGVWTATAHGLVVGEQFTLAAPGITGAVPAIPAGTYTVATVPTVNTFTVSGITVLTTPGTTGTITPISTTARQFGFTSDNDCSGGPPTGVPNNGDGVVLFHILQGNASAGDVKTVTVSQDAVGQTFDVNVVGSPNNVTLTLFEKVIETNGNTANVTACEKFTPLDTSAISSPTSTIAYAVVTDKDNTVLTRVPVTFKVTPPEDSEIAHIGKGDPGEEVTSNSFFSIHPKTAGLQTAAYVVLCGGKETGVATIDAAINGISCALTGCTILSSKDHDSQTLTVTGAPSSNVLTAEASSIKCDGSEKSTVTAKVTDSKGNNVADGVPVNFSVVALGTANPINTVTKDGKATSVITPLSNSSAGVTVIVSAGDVGIAAVVQTSVRVDCALPLAAQAPAPVATPRGGIAGPDTGNGGYLGQNSSNSFPMWAVLALVLGSVTLMAGGLVTRRAGK